MQEISPLPNAGSELAIPPAEPIAPARPSAWNRKWTVAIIASCLLHAAVAAAFLIAPAGTFDSRDAIQAEGTDQSGADVVGSALDGQAPDVMDVTLVPDPRPAKPEPVRPVPPTDTPQPSKEAAAPKPPPEAAKTDAPDILTAATPRQTTRMSLQAAKRRHRPQFKHKAPRRLLSMSLLPLCLLPSHRSQPRGQAPQPGLEEQAKQTMRVARQMARNATQAVVSSKGKKQAVAGNAMESRYSGEIQKKLARANRRVSKSVQEKAHNNARVVFVVMADGSISDLQLAESSGSAELDQFALTLVRQQAPFPPIPPETGRSSWVFKARIGPF